jgi:hypothetical protein
VPPIYKALALNVAAGGAHFAFGWVAGGLGPFHQAAMKMLRVRAAGIGEGIPGRRAAACLGQTLMYAGPHACVYANCAVCHAIKPHPLPPGPPPQVDRAPALVAVFPYRGPDGPKDGPPGSLPLAIQPFRGPLKYQLMAMWLRGMAAAAGVRCAGGARGRSCRAQPGGGA